MENCLQLSDHLYEFKKGPPTLFFICVQLITSVKTDDIRRTNKKLYAQPLLSIKIAYRLLTKGRLETNL